VSSIIESLSRFSPHFIHQRLQSSRVVPDECLVETFPAAVMFADISGFSPLANRLAQIGPEGAEELDRILNAYYGRLVDLIHQHGGDVAAFAGDAAIAIWRATEPSLPATIRRAAQGGLEIQRQLNRYQVDETVELSVKICLGAGQLAARNVGGMNDVWNGMVVGEPLEQIRAAGPYVRSGDVVLTSECRRSIGGRPVGKRVGDAKASGGKHFRLNGFRKPEPVAPLRSPDFGVDAADALRSFIPPTVLTRLDAGQAAWLSDLRQLTVMFVMLKGPDPPPAQLLQWMHAAMREMQATMSRFQGDAIHLIQDDKGLIGVLCFGLPPHIHEDDADRAVASAFELQERLEAIGLTASIGITAGRVFSGIRGSDRRCEYSITGSVVNLAARLMAVSDGEVLCDTQTRLSSRGYVEFEALPAIRLKGVDQPVPVFRANRLVTKSTTKRKAINGRVRELLHIDRFLEGPLAGDQRVLLIEGEAGISKTVLLEEMIERATSSGWRVCRADCDAVERATPYFPWRDILRSILEIGEFEDEGQQKSRVLSSPALNDSLRSRVSLLNPFLPFNFEEPEIVTQLANEARADITHDLVLAVLSHGAAVAPLLVAVDDVHWQDSASWKLMALAAQRLDRARMVMSARPFSDPLAAEASLVIGRETTDRMPLDNLELDAVESLILERTGATQLGTEVIEFLYERSAGNPFFVEELIHFLEEAELMTVTNGTCRLAPSVRKQGDGVPGSVRALITNRIDRLIPAQQMTLKTASVVGRSFAKKTLLAVYELEADKSGLDNHLEHVTNLRLVQIESADPELTYLFRHLTIQQVIYDQMPVRHRRTLHRSLAEWYASSNAENPSFFPLLAYHWGHSGEVEKEIEYLAKSGEEAARRFANREAVDFFSAAVAKLETLSDRNSHIWRRWRAHWTRQIGESQFHLGDLPATQTNLESSLKQMGRPAARTRFGIRLDIVVQALIQLSHRLFPNWMTSDQLVPAEEENRAGLQEAALALQRLSQVHYLRIDMALGVTRAVRGLNLAERAGRSPLLARAYSGVSLVIGLLRVHRLAEMYARWSVATARETGHMPTSTYVLMATGVYRLGIGQWDVVQPEAAEAIALARQIGDQRLLGEAMVVEAIRCCFLGDHRAAYRWYEELYETAQRGENTVHEGWSFSGRGECLFRRGDLSDSLDMFHSALELLADSDHRTEEIRLNGLIATALWRLGRADEAIHYMEKMRQTVANTSYTTSSTLDAYVGVAEICLDRWQREPDREEFRQDVIQACQHMAWYAKVFPIGRPRLDCLLARKHWIGGDTIRAVQFLDSGVRRATRMQMPYDLAYAHLAYASSVNVASAKASIHARAAVLQFEQLGCSHELSAARSLVADTL